MELETLIQMTLADVLTNDAARASVLRWMLHFTGTVHRGCDSAIGQYLSQLKFKSDYYLKLKNDMENRTCVPAWAGLLYYNGNHYLDRIITDAQATELLANGGLLPSHFAVLPKSEPPTEAEATPEVEAPTEATPEVEVTTEVAATPAKRPYIKTKREE